MKEKRLQAAFLILSGLTLLMFVDALFSPRAVLLGQLGTDLSAQFVYWYEFGFGQLAQGNLALWNPHIFSGMPFFVRSTGPGEPGSLESPHLLGNAFLWRLPVCLALSTQLVVSGAAHCQGRQCEHRTACAFSRPFPVSLDLSPGTAPGSLSSILYMFSGPLFLHIYAGHLPHLAAMAWAPLLFCAIDGLIRERSTLWYLVGVLALTMQILAGHPQYVFYTAIAAGLYSLLRLIKSPRPAHLLLGLGGMYLGAAALTAVQLLAGLQAAGESVRSSGTPYAFAAMFSFPPENFLTLLVPSLFGSIGSYWGRWYLWEMSLFISVTGLAWSWPYTELCAAGGICGSSRSP
jgi:xanthosine utilization system XapX-like protein